MKKKIFTVLTLLVAFFGLMGLTVSTKQVEVQAAGNQATVDSDMSVVLNNIPSRAILSFPVTYQSVHGNTISFAVEADQSVIAYDSEAHWMVVNRPTEADAEIDITVTVTGADSASATQTKTVTVPKGVTATRSFSISYNLNGGSQDSSNPDSYQLGAATIELKAPSKEGHIFEGWYEQEDFSGNKVEKIYVGSMKDYNLYAKFTPIAITSIKVESYEKNQIAGTEFNQTNLVVKAVKNDNTEETVPNSELEFTAINHETKKVTITWEGFSVDVDVTVSLNSFDVTNVTVTEVTKVYDGKTITLADQITGVPEGVTATFYNGETPVTELVNAGTYNLVVKFSHDNVNYNKIDGTKEVTFVINKLSLTLTPINEKTSYAGIALPTWSNADFSQSGLLDSETLDQVLGTANYGVTYELNGEVANPDEATTDTKYDVVFTVPSATNYEVVINKNGVLNIKFAPVTFEVVQVLDGYTYNGEDQTVTVIAKDKETGAALDEGTYTITYTANTFKDAGIHNVEFEFSHNTYGTLDGTLSVEFAKANASITAVTNSSIYGDAIAGLDYTVSGFFNNDDSALEIKVSTNATATSPVGTDYVITPSYNTEAVKAKNYNITVNTATYSIEKRKVTVKAHSNKTSEYLDEVVALTYTAEGLVGDDSLAGYVTLTSAASNTANAGIYPITVTASEHDNYEIIVDSTEVYYVITPKELSNENTTITLEQIDSNLQDVNSLKPSVTVKYNKDATNSYDVTSFTTTYTYGEENIDTAAEGKATVKATFSGNYSGSVTVQFDVTALPKALEDAKELDELMTSVTTLSNGTELPSTLTWGSTVNWVADTTGVSVVDNKVVIDSAFVGTSIVLKATVSYGDTSADARAYTVSVATDYKTFKDDVNDVTIENVKNEYDVTVEKAENPSDGNYTVEGYDTLAAYDITFEDSSSNVVHNPGTVTVKLPAPENYTLAQLKVYHIEGTTQTLVEDVQLIDGYLVFQANSFSPYVIVTLKPVVETFQITFKVEDKTTIVTVNKGKTPVYDGTPTKEATDKFTYEFAGWSPDIVPATENATYIAQFNELVEVEVYELVTDASTLSVGDKIIIVNSEAEVALGIAKTNNYGQTAIKLFNSITNQISNAQIITLEAGNMENTFAFNVGTGYLYAASSSDNYLKTEETLSDNSSWIITIDENGNAKIVAQGTNTRNTIRYNSTSDLFSCYESGQADIQIYRYTSKQVNSDLTYSVTWMNSDGEILKVDENVSVNSIPSYTGATPTIDSTPEFTFEFSGWTPEIKPAIYNVTYTAVYSEITNSYTITWIDYDGTIIKEDTVLFGIKPTAPSPTREGYIFTGWDKTVDTVKGNETYTAQYTEQTGETPSEQIYTAEFDFSTQGYANASDISTVTINDYISVIFDIGTGKSSPKYYTSGTAVRLYYGGTMTVSSNTAKIKSIVITYGSSDGKNSITYTASNSSNDFSESGDFTASLSFDAVDEIIFTVGGTSGNRRIKSIVIEYVITA